MASKDRSDSEWTVQDVDDLEARLERLRALYDMYFRGFERTEPVTLRKQVYRLVLGANPSSVSNTALRFRLRTLIQRFNTFQSQWNRIAMQKERGTYHRDVQRAIRREADRANPTNRRSRHMQRRLNRLLAKGGRLPPEEEKPKPEASPPAPAPGAPPQAQPSSAAAQAARARASAAATRPPPAPMKQDELRSVYDQLIQARRSCSQSVRGMSYELIAQRLQATRSSILSSSGARDVRFEVAVENGKARLKAIPRKK